jgi:hypothetical protein
MEGARLLADALYLRDPYWVKHYIQTWGRTSRREYGVISEEPVFMPLEEQTELFANRIRRLKQYQFLVRPAESEGTISTDVFPINISTVTQDPKTGALHFPDRELIEELRAILAARAGIPIADLIQEQDASLARYTNVVEGQLRRSPPIRQRPHQNGAPAATRTEPKPPVTAPATAPAGTHGRQVTRRVRIS